MGLEMVKFLNADKCPLLNNIIKKIIRDKTMKFVYWIKKWKIKEKLEFDQVGVVEHS